MNDPGPIDPLVLGIFCVFFGGRGRRGGGSTTSFDYFVGYLFIQLFLKVRASPNNFCGGREEWYGFLPCLFCSKKK